MYISEGNDKRDHGQLYVVCPMVNPRIQHNKFKGGIRSEMLIVYFSEVNFYLLTANALYILLRIS